MPRKRNPENAIQVRFSDAEYAQIEDQRRQQKKIPTLGAMVRALVNEALERKQDNAIAA